MNTKLLVALGVAAVAAVVVVALPGDTPHPQAAPAPKATAARTAEQVSDAPAPGADGVEDEAGYAGFAALPTRRWQPGETFVYDVVVTRSIALNGPDPSLRRGLRGKLSLTVAAIDDELVHVQGVFAGKDWEQPRSEDSFAGIDAPFFATFDGNGRLEGLHVSKATAMPAKDRLGALLSDLQFVAPEDAEQSWRAEETEPGGDYVARYRQVGEREVSKKRHRYVRVVGANGLQPSEDAGKFTLGGGSKVEVGDHGWPTLVTSDQTVDIATDMITVQYTNALAAKLVDVSKGQAPVIEWASLVTLPLTSTTDDAGLDRRADVNKVAGRSFEQLAAEMAALLAEHGHDPKKFPSALSALAAKFRLDPAAAAAAVDQIKRAEDIRVAKAMTAALGLAGTPEAQVALTDTLRDREVETERRNAASIALATTENATAETLNELAEIPADDPAYKTATLALGGAIQHADEGVDTNDAVLELIQRWTTAQTYDDKLLIIAALGNAGDIRGLEVLKQAAEDPVLLSAAISALRYMPGGEVDALLIKAIIEGDDAHRLAAVDAMRYRSPASFAVVLMDRLANDRVEKVRYYAASILASLATDDTVFAALDAASAGDPSARVREAALRALGA